MLKFNWHLPISIFSFAIFRSDLEYIFVNFFVAVDGRSNLLYRHFSGLSRIFCVFFFFMIVSAFAVIPLLQLVVNVVLADIFDGGQMLLFAIWLLKRRTQIVLPRNPFFRFSPFFYFCFLIWWILTALRSPQSTWPTYQLCYWYIVVFVFTVMRSVHLKAHLTSINAYIGCAVTVTVTMVTASARRRTLGCLLRNACQEFLWF